jgi:hypothetical protein
MTKKEEKKLKVTKERLDSLLASECTYCGPSIVDQIYIPFELNKEEQDSWAI